MSCLSLQRQQMHSSEQPEKVLFPILWAGMLNLQKTPVLQFTPGQRFVLKTWERICMAIMPWQWATTFSLRQMVLK